MSKTKTLFDVSRKDMEAAKSKGGRPRARTVSFAARLLAVILECSDRHARRLIAEPGGVNHLQAPDWYFVALAVERGIEDPDAFQQWLVSVGYL